MPLIPTQHIVAAYGGSSAASAAELEELLDRLPLVKIVSLAAAGVALVALVEEVEDKAENHPPCFPPAFTRSIKNGKPEIALGAIWECPTCGRRHELVGIPKFGFKGEWTEVAGPHD